MVVLDTDYLIDLMQGRTGAVDLLDELLASLDPLTVSAISIMELHHGIVRANLPARERSRVEGVLEGLSIQPLTHNIAALAGELDGQLYGLGQPLNPLDVMIGATALHLREPLVTRNLQHYQRIEGLLLQTYDDKA